MQATAGKPTFIGIETSSYSGATLLALLLNAHPEIVSIGEMNGLIPSEDPERYTCSCGQRIKDCEFWQAMGREMALCGYGFDVAHFDTEFRLSGPRWMQRLRVGSFRSRTLDSIRDRALTTLPSERRQFATLVARNIAFIQTVLKITGKRIFVDTSKDHLRARALRLFSSMDVRVIHLVRDPRGVAASRLRRSAGIEARQAAREWVRLHTRLEYLLDTRASDGYVTVRYEDLCQEPQAVLGKLYAFCGADPEFRLTDWASTPHHIVGNAMRLNNLSSVRLDEGWRKSLTEQQQQEIWQVAGRLGAQYGYRP